MSDGEMAAAAKRYALSAPPAREGRGRNAVSNRRDTRITLRVAANDRDGYTEAPCARPRGGMSNGPERET